MRSRSEVAAGDMVLVEKSGAIGKSEHATPDEKSAALEQEQRQLSGARTRSIAYTAADVGAAMRELKAATMRPGGALVKVRRRDLAIALDAASKVSARVQELERVFAALAARADAASGVPDGRSLDDPQAKGDAGGAE